MREGFSRRILTLVFSIFSLLLITGCPAWFTNRWWQVYFTTPGSENNQIQDKLVQLIEKAQTSIHIAAFEFNLDPIADALVKAKQRGVEVKWVTDDEHGLAADLEKGHGQFAKLKKAGIKVKNDARSGLMHNKFVIIDSQTVWTGSTNLTINGTQRNNNNVIVMRSPEVAAIYEKEFQEMWGGKFGKGSPSTVAQQKVIVNDTPISVLFGSEDDVADALTRLISNTKSDVKFMSFSFTHDDMGKAMLAKANQGVRVQGIFETRGSQTQFSELPRLFCQGIPVRQDGNPRTLHHKVIVLDKETVITGSFNFSNNANQRNDENVVILDNPGIAKLYLQEFERRWEEGKRPDKAKLNCP